MSFFDPPPHGPSGHSRYSGQAGGYVGGAQRSTTGSRRAARMQAKRDRRRARAAGIVVLVLVITLVVVGVVAAWKFLPQMLGESGADYPGPGEGQVIVQITEGQPIKSIGAMLTERQVVASQGAFVRAAQDTQDSLLVRPGWYKLRERMSAKQALDALLDPNSRAELRVTIPEGLQVPEIVQRLATARGLPVEQFNAALANPDLGLPPYANGKPEGFLYPSTYEYAPNASPLEMVMAMVQRFIEKAQEFKIDQFAPRRSAEQILTVASLVQAEAKHAKDFPKVARVVYNRLDKPMKLQFDSTVNYALGRAKVVVTTKDTQVDSPYNTYRNLGLPPGPINMPETRFLNAVLNPAKHDFLYFCARSDLSGHSDFARTYEQHMVNARRYQRALNERGIFR